MSESADALCVCCLLWPGRGIIEAGEPIINGPTYGMRIQDY